MLSRVSIPSAFLARIASSRVSPFAAGFPDASTISAASSSSHSTSSCLLHTPPTLTSSSSLYGIGVDICLMSRISQVYSRHGSRFLKKFLAPNEIMTFQRMIDDDEKKVHEQQKVSYLAGRWAVKEAMVKATGKRLLFPEIEVMRQEKQTTEDASIDPTIAEATPSPSSAASSSSHDPRARILLHGSVSAWFAQEQLSPSPLVSISHDGEYVVAFVCVEKGT